MSVFNYRLNCDDYVLHAGDEPVDALTPEIAMAFSFDGQDNTWALYKHGAPATVHAWVDKNKRAQVGPGLADNLHVLEGKLPVADLNRCLQNGAHIESLLKNCQAIGDGQDYAARTFQLDGTNLADNPRSLRQILSPGSMKDASARFGATPEADVVDVNAKPLAPPSESR